MEHHGAREFAIVLDDNPIPHSVPQYQLDPLSFDLALDCAAEVGASDMATLNK